MDVHLCDGYSFYPDVNHHLPLLTVVDVQGVDFTPEEEVSDDFPIPEIFSLRYKSNNGCIIRELLEVIVRLNRESDVCKEEGKEERRELLFTQSDFWLSNTLLVWLQEFSLIW